jgi:undecaprenyl-diphosphatase
MDAAFFYAINKLAGASPFWDGVWVFLATYFIWLEFAAIAGFFFGEIRKRYLAVGSAAVSAGVSYLVSEMIGYFWFRPRPFAALGGVHELVPKFMTDKSFPSDHATVAFALAMSIFLVNRRWGILMFLIAFLVSVGRILVGVHYPSDVFVGALLGCAVAYLLHRLVHEFLHTKHHLPR